jgi:hypothetical protein
LLWFLFFAKEGSCAGYSYSVKPIALALFLLSLGVLIFSGSANAASINKNKADRVTAKKVLANYGQARSAIAKKKVSDALLDKVSAEVTCTQNMLEAIEESALSEEDRFAWSLSVFFVYVYDIYFTVASSSKTVLRKQEAVLKRKTKRLMKRSKTKAAKTMARSLKAQGSFAAIFARNIDISMCTIKTKVEELGGYTSENLGAAVMEELERSGFLAFLDSPAADSIEKFSDQIGKGSGEMRRIRPRINAKRITRYEEGLMDAIFGKLRLAKRVKANSLPLEDASLIEGRSRILKLAK